MSTQPSFAPSRRRLGALLAAGATAALPVLPAIAAPTQPDAALIAFANEVRRLAERDDWAWRTLAALEDAAELAEPERPTFERAFPGRETYPEYPAAELRQIIADAAADVEQADPWMTSMRSRLARMEVYEAECARLRQHHRIDAARTVASRTCEQVKAAAADLADMRATTLAGIAAKARAALVGDAFRYNAEWAEELAASILRDLVAIGGAA